MKIKAIILILLLTVSEGICADKVITITLRNDAPPLSFVNVDGDPVGMYVDIWKLWAEKTGQKIQFRAEILKDTLESLKNGTADIHSALNYSEERSQWMALSQPFYEISLCVFFPKNQEKIHNIRELKGYKAGVITSPHEKSLCKDYPDIEFIPFAAIGDMIQAAREGRIRAFIGSPQFILMTLYRMGLAGEFESTDEILFARKVHAGVLKENTELLALIDKGFDLISDKEFADIEARWIPEPDKRYFNSKIRQIKLTAEEKAWIEKHPVVTFGISSGFAPFTFIGHDSRPDGMGIEYLQLLIKRTGINMQVTLAEPWENLISHIQKKSIDGVVCAGKTSEREKYFSFTNSYLITPWVIITRSNSDFFNVKLNDLAGKKVAVLKTGPVDEIIQSYPEIEMNYIRTVEEICEVVSMGRSDAGITNLASASYYIMKNGITNLKVAGVLENQLRLSMGIQKDHYELLNILNKAIDSISPEEHAAIRKKWMSLRYEQGVEWRTVLRWIAIIGVIFLSVLITTLIWNRRLAREIAERRQADQALRESEERLEFVLEGSQLGYWDWNILTGEVWRNHRWAEMLGYTLQEIDFNVRQWTDMVHPDDRTVAWQSLQDHLEGRKTMHKSEYRMLTKDGHWKWILDQAKIVKYDAQGQPARMSGTHTDITERKQAENSLRDREKMLRDILDGSPIPTFVINKEHRITHWNRMLENLSGISANQVIGTNRQWRAFYDSERPCMADLLVDGLYDSISDFYSDKYHQSAINNEIRLFEATDFFPSLGKNGRWMRFTAATINDSQGSVIGAIETLEDVTDRKQAEEERLELERRLLNMRKLESLGRISAGIAHNFNNILYAVTGNIEMAMEDIPPMASTRQILENALNAANRAAELTHKILAYSGSGFFRFRKVDVTRVIEKNIRDFKSVIPENTDFSINLTEDIPLINADPEQIQRVIMNVLVNASEAVGENAGTVILSTGVSGCCADSLKNGFERIDDPEGKHISGRSVYIEISDTGCGMNEESVKVLADPFFTTKFMGRGLGMSEVQGIVRNHKGAILVKSGLGQGTTIRVLFPVSEGTV